MEQKNNSFLVTLLSVLLLISVFIAGFFAYKTQDLVKEITKIRLISTPIVIATPTPDPTANWKTYINSKYNFSFKYPGDFINNKINNNSIILFVGNKDYSLSLKTDSDLNIYTGEINDIKRLFDTNEQNVNIKSIGPYPAYLRSTQSAGGEFSFHRIIIIATGSEVIDFSLSPKDQNNFISTEILADQILSTFKFIEPVASLSPTTSPRP